MYMSSKSEKYSLEEALVEANLARLPRQYENGTKGIWAMAVVRIQKVNTRINYAIAINNGHNGVTIIKDFGEPAKVKEVLAIYPYIFVPEKDIPDLRNKSDIISFLSLQGYDEHEVSFLLSTKDANGTDKTDEVKKADRETVKGWVISSSIKKTVEDEKLRKLRLKGEEEYETKEGEQEQRDFAIENRTDKE